MVGQGQERERDGRTDRQSKTSTFNLTDRWRAKDQDRRERGRQSEIDSETDKQTEGQTDGWTERWRDSHDDDGEKYDSVASATPHSQLNFNIAHYVRV